MKVPLSVPEHTSGFGWLLFPLVTFPATVSILQDLGHVNALPFLYILYSKSLTYE